MHTFNYYRCCCCCWMFWLAFGRKIKLLLFSHENNTTGAPASAPSGTQCRREGAPSHAWRCVGVPYRWTVQEKLKVFFPPLKDGLIFCEDGCLWRLGPGYMSWSQKPTALDQLRLSILPFPEESVLGSNFPSPANIVSERAAISKLKWSSSQLTRAVRRCGLSTSSWDIRVCTIHAPTVSFSFCFRFILVYWPHTKVPSGRGLPVRGGGCGDRCLSHLFKRSLHSEWAAVLPSRPAQSRL